MVAKADFVFHLVDVNQPKDEIEFAQGNADLPQKLVTVVNGHWPHHSAGINLIHSG